MVLQHAPVISILRCVVTGGEGSFKLGILLGGLPIFLFDMLLMTKRDLGT